MSKLIEKACVEVAQTNMWDRAPKDSAPIASYIEEISKIGVAAQEHFQDLGAEEQDIADAIHYIAQVYSIPVIRNDVQWFRDVLFTILEPAFPNGGVSDEAERFAQKLISGLQEQVSGGL